VSTIRGKFPSGVTFFPTAPLVQPQKKSFIGCSVWLSSGNLHHERPYKCWTTLQFHLWPSYQYSDSNHVLFRKLYSDRPYPGVCLETTKPSTYQPQHLVVNVHGGNTKYTENAWHTKRTPYCIPPHGCSHRSLFHRKTVLARKTESGLLMTFSSSWFQASAAMLMRSAPFRDITRRRVVIVYRRFGTCRFRLQGPRARNLPYDVA
jgi:hypothetical protein